MPSLFEVMAASGVAEISKAHVLFASEAERQTKFVKLKLFSKNLSSLRSDCKLQQIDGLEKAARLKLDAINLSGV